MDNRSNILSCALQLFASRGYDAVGVQEIVESAGVTKPTLYHYFGSKRGLLDALLEERLAPLGDAVQRAAAYAGDLPQTLHDVVTAYFDYARANSTFYRMQLSMWFAPPDSDPFRAVARLHQEQLRYIEDVFTSAVKDHGNLRGHHQAYAITLLGMINNYIAFSQNGTAKLDDQLARQAVQQFMYGIYSL